MWSRAISKCSVTECYAGTLGISRRLCSAAFAKQNSPGSGGRQVPPQLDYVIRKPGIKARIIDGKRLAEKIHNEIASEVHDIVSRANRPPNLTVVLVGDDPASHTYVRNKRLAAVKVGMEGKVIHKPSSTTEEELLELVNQLNRNHEVDGILVQLPLPPHINEQKICQSINPYKDVDGFHMDNVGRYCMGHPAFIPATPLGVLEMLKRCHVETFGKTACVVGRSKNIGFTLAAILHSDGYGSGNPVNGADATTIVCHRYTPSDELRRMTQAADIVITGTGIPGLIRGDMIKEGATVIDIGITKVKDEQGKTKLVGDVEFSEAANVASLITPVPGGVGPMTVAMVLQNTKNAATGIYKDSDLKIGLYKEHTLVA